MCRPTAAMVGGSIVRLVSAPRRSVFMHVSRAEAGQGRAEAPQVRVEGAGCPCHAGVPALPVRSSAEQAEARPAVRPECHATMRSCKLRQEEIKRRRERASRFETTDALESYQPAVDLEEVEKRKKRAEKFGVEYQPDDAAGLMDVGAPRPCFLHQVHCCLLVAHPQDTSSQRLQYQHK